MEMPKRKNNRLKDFDYNTQGAYFVTICTHNKQKILCDIVGAIHESPAIKLKPCGEITCKIIECLPHRFGINVDKYVIMPNHIHIIIGIDDERAIRESPLHRRSIIDKAIGYLKMNVSKEFHKLTPVAKIWQRSYHDHIIRDEADYLKIWQYIDTNPAKWEEDCFYTK